MQNLGGSDSARWVELTLLKYLEAFEFITYRIRRQIIYFFFYNFDFRFIFFFG